MASGHEIRPFSDNRAPQTLEPKHIPAAPIAMGPASPEEPWPADSQPNPFREAETAPDTGHRSGDGPFSGVGRFERPSRDTGTRRPSALALANDATAEPAILDVLARDSDQNVREAVAKSPRLLEHTWQVLSLDPAWQVRAQLALNPVLPHDIQSLLAQDPDYAVRFRLAQNSHLAIRVFIRLATDANPLVRRILTTNTATPFHLPAARMPAVAEARDGTEWTMILSKDRVPEDLRTKLLAPLAAAPAPLAFSPYFDSHPENVSWLASNLLARAISAERADLGGLLLNLCHASADPSEISGIVALGKIDATGCLTEGFVQTLADYEYAGNPAQRDALAAALAKLG